MGLTIQELVGGHLMSAASHGALLKEKGVQLTHRSGPLREVIDQLFLMNRQLLLGERLWMEVHYGHSVALSVGPHCNLSPVSPLVEQQAGLERREANEVLVAPGNQFVLLRRAHKVISIDTHNVSPLPRAHVVSNSFGVPVNSSVDGKRGLVPVAIPDW